MKASKIERNLLEKAGQEFSQSVIAAEDSNMLVSQNKRQAHYEQSLKNK